MSGEIMAFKRTLELVVVQCCSCHVEYALPQDLVNRLYSEKEKRSTWCPNGHQWHYVGKSDSTRREEAEERASAAEQKLRALRNEKKVTVHPGVATTNAGKKPCPVCGRYFERLSTHQTLMKHWKPATLKAL